MGRGPTYSYHEHTEAGHHRTNASTSVGGAHQPIARFAQSFEMAGQNPRVVMVKRERRLWNKTTTEVCFYITSLGADARVLGKAIRSHWGIENSRPWILDVTFGEDHSRIRTPSWTNEYGTAATQVG
ncbi:ISAs1 family transposase [Moorena producens]|uniref:ISAs1 family transposase n=1 Tax=Moorena producens TaxID=1155739 RepID=UPI002D21E226|nr:ISAs1 family transposase [Moorena producens]